VGTIVGEMLTQILTPGCGTAVALAAGGHFLVDLALYGAVGLIAYFTGRKRGHSTGHSCSKGHHG